MDRSVELEESPQTDNNVDKDSEVTIDLHDDSNVSACRKKYHGVTTYYMATIFGGKNNSWLYMSC